MTKLTVTGQPERIPTGLPEKIASNIHNVGSSTAANVIKPKRIKSVYAKIAHNVKNVQSRGVPGLS